MRLVIAGGGTGGHLFPGVAIAEEIRARDPASEVLFVGTERGIEARVLPKLGWPHRFIEASGLKTVGALGALRGLLRVPRALWQSRRILREFRPDAVIGVGGYASGPVVLAAALAGLPTAVLEQNSIPGLANKILGRFVRAVFIAFDETRAFFKPARVQLSGNPIRRDLLARLSAAGQPADAPGRRVFCFGGSLGARAVNGLMVDAAVALAKDGFPLELVHQTGPDEAEAVAARYAEAGVHADVRGFIDDMAAEYGRADLVIARAGATSLAELTAVGRPAILIPYPFAADNHQEKNAQALAAAGAALVFRQGELDGPKLAAAVRELLSDPARLGAMQAATRALARPDAAATIAAWLEAQAAATTRTE
jgi:UDP-N-acetylglucosamine--N-acetylmuramyl-(pentapeptide) pyrophosphoryl-undecaprenol N-acetylglucosamine transferase